MAGDMTATRIAENQSRFREANEQIEAAAGRLQVADPIPFLCECPREPCMEILRLTVREYEGVRSSPTLFVCAPGHEDISVEAGAAKVVGGEEGRFVLVDKVGVAGEIAAARFDDTRE
jgi:hypothetical protein